MAPRAKDRVPGESIMKRLPAVTDVRIEAVTTTFVAAGTPDGIHDLGRFMENLNNPSIGSHIELSEPALRPLYRAGGQLWLDAPLLVKREDIIFANFEGPHLTRGAIKPPTTDVRCLLMAPPFQISGTVQLTPGADATQALRALCNGFFVVRHATVFDADGSELGEGELIVVNGAAVQMTSATAAHIAESAQPAPQLRFASGAFAEDEASPAAAAPAAKQERAA
jgi:hypothetical protein